MNELLAHVNYVRDHLDDRTAARSLVDHYQEAQGLTRREALHAVAKMRKVRRDTAELAAAAAVMADKDGIGHEVEVLIREAGSESWRLLCPILIVPGSRYPEPTDDRAQAIHRAYWHMVIRIGARRVLMMAEFYRSTDDSDGWLPFAPDGDIINR